MVESLNTLSGGVPSCGRRDLVSGLAAGDGAAQRSGPCGTFDAVGDDKPGLAIKGGH